MNWFHTLLTAATEATEEVIENNPTSAMDLSGLLNVLLTVMLLVCGVYGLYTVIRLRRTYMLFSNKFLYPGNCKPEDCLDEDGFIDYIMPRLTILSIAMLVFGAAFVLNTYIFKLSTLWIDLATIILPFGSFLWYILVQRKAAKLYWDV